MNDEIKEKIAVKIIEILASKFENFPDRDFSNRNAPFHQAFLQPFEDKLKKTNITTSYLISLSSWLHGLSTSLGQSFFEKCSHYISGGEKKEFKKQLKITQHQKNEVNQIITDLKNGQISPNLIQENSQIFITTQNAQQTDATNFTADVFLERNNTIIAIEIKSVRCNSGEMKTEKQKILEAKAALYNLYSQQNKEIKYYIAFPYDPTIDVQSGKNPWDIDRIAFLNYVTDLKKFFDPDEMLIGSEFWDFLSRENNTFQTILDILQTIANDKFFDNYQYLQDKKHRQNTKFISLVNKWYLFSESRIHNLYKKYQNNSEFKKCYEADMFNKKGKYNWKRIERIKNFCNRNGEIF